jgi:hypothetical protein
MSKKKQPLGTDDPLRHADHPRPTTRRDFIKQGFISGPAAVLTGGAFSLFTNPNKAFAAVSSDLNALATDVGCSIGALTGATKVPFICFDLAGGANFAGSNVLVGQSQGQMDLLSTAGYSKMGLPGDILPGQVEAAGQSLSTLATSSDFTNDTLGLKFHSDSPMLFGILEKFKSGAVGATDAGKTEGAVIPARSGNDTSNNTHNPLYGIAQAGAVGDVVTLIGSRNTESGGNSMAPPGLIDPSIRPTKVDRTSDVTGMVDVGDLTSILSSKEDVTAVMESMARISHKKLKQTATPVTSNAVITDLVECGYLTAADLAQRFAGQEVDPGKDPIIVGPTGIFGQEEFDNESEFRKTASVMKMVIDGNAGAGSITMGGFDYHTGDRIVGENRDLRAGRCIGACLEYAAAIQKPLMIYVFSDGSLASNGTPDNTPAGNPVIRDGNPVTRLGGRGKGQWTGDNSSTACSFFLVFNPAGKATPLAGSTLPDPRQIGRFSANGSVVTSATPAANNVNLLVNTLLANYMSLNGDLNQFPGTFANHGLGDYTQYVSFGPLA